jgi:hypothetical protein
MSKKTFFILLFIGVLFISSLLIGWIRGVQNQLSMPIAVDVPFVSQKTDHNAWATSTPMKVGTTSPLVFDTFTSEAIVTNPLILTGKAPGTWYFEASFPVRIEDTAGNILGQGSAEATEDWMTAKLVPFKLKITFKKTNAEDGFVIFHNDNPSGDSKNSKEVRVPIVFKIFLQ